MVSSVERRLEARLAQVRRRRNARELGGVAGFALGAVGAAATVLALAAPALPAAAFAVLLWASIAAVAAGVVLRLRTLRRRWYGRANAALRVDRAAGLEDRLATLDHVRRTDAHPAFRALLARDNRDHVRRWSPHELVPLLVSRDWVLAAIALLVASTIFHQRQIPLPGFPGAGSLAASASSEAVAEERRDRGIAAAIQGWMAGSAATGIGASLSGKALSGDVATAANGAPALASAPSGADAEGDGEAGAARGAPPTARGERRAEGPRDDAVSLPLEDSLPRGEGLVRTEAVDVPAESDAPRAGSGSGSGAGAAGDPDSLFAGAADRAGPGTLVPFAFDIAGEARRSPEGSEAAEISRERVAAELSRRQRVDDAVRRAFVPPEYEASVRRLFQDLARRGSQSARGGSEVKTTATASFAPDASPAEGP